MAIPIAFDSIEANSKCTEERREWANWFVFRESPDGTRVDVVDRYGDICVNMPWDKADALVKARDAFLVSARAAMTKDGTYRY